MNQTYIRYNNAVTQEDNHIIMSERLYSFIYRLRNTEERIKLSNLIYNIVDWRSNANSGLLYNKEGFPVFDYLDMRGEDCGLISYIPYGKTQQIADDGRWKRDGRQTIKIGKFIKKFFNEKTLSDYNITDNTVENISKATTLYGNTKNIRFEVVSSYADIVDTYLYSNTYDSSSDNDNELYPGGTATSSMDASCMRHSKCSEWFECYGKDDNIKLIRMVDIPTGKFLARAILWHNVLTHTGELIQMMDRVYAYREWMIDAMLDWANDNAYYRKQKQAMDYKTQMISPEGIATNLGLSFTFNETYEYWPYLDTFTFMEGDAKTVNNNYDNFKYRWELSSYDDGNAHVYKENNNLDDYDDDDEDGIYVESRGECFPDDEVVVVDGSACHIDDCTRVNGTWYNNDSEYLTWVDSRGEYYHVDDVNYVPSRDEYFPEHETMYVQREEEYYHCNDVVYDSHNDEDVVAEDAIYCKYHQTHIHKDDFEFISELGEDVHKDFVVDCKMSDGSIIRHDVNVCEELNGLYYEQGHVELTIKEEAHV
jgi:hypothetical protein